MLKAIEPVNDLFQKVVDYCTYHPMKQLARYEDDVGHELQRMAKKTAVWMQDRTFSGIVPTSVIAFFDEFTSGCDASRINEGQAAWLFEQYFTGPAEAAVRSHVVLQDSVNTGHEGGLRTYSEVVSIHLKRLPTEDSIANLDDKVCSLWKRALSPTILVQRLWTCSLACRSVYVGKALKAMFVEGVQSLIRNTLRR